MIAPGPYFRRTKPKIDRVIEYSNRQLSFPEFSNPNKPGISMNKKITAEQFLDAFGRQWKEAVEENSEEINQRYCNDSTWTDFMQKDENSFLRRLSERLSFDVGMEFQTLDCVYYKKESNQIEGYESFAACLDVIIEHENQDDIEFEMWKFLIFRSPLKVLIFYDWSENEKERSEKRRNWLNDKLSGLLRMGSEFGVRWPEADDTEYLFLVGNRTGEGEMPRWRHMAIKSRDFKWRSKLSPSEYLQPLWI